jgi:hypothetical protein
MRNMFVGTCVVGMLSAGTAMLAAPGNSGSTYQQATDRPGYPTQAHVWIDNSPLPVALTGTATVTLSERATVQAKMVRQAWEYRVISIPAGQPATGQQLTAAGADGWEAIGGPFQTSDGVSLLLKRPEQAIR